MENRDLEKNEGGKKDPTGEDLDPKNLGRGIHRRTIEKFAALPDEDRRKMLKDTWAEVAMGAATRAKQFVATCSPKDFGRLYQMIMSGAVAIDKAFPPQKQEIQAPAFVVNMFGSLGQRAAAIASPTVPTIDVTPKEVEWQSSPTKMNSSLPTSSESSLTKTPSTVS